MSERNYFAGKIEDLIARAVRGEEMIFSEFLTPEEGVAAENICKRAGVPALLWGGYPESERKMLGFSSMEKEVFQCCFPMVLLRIVGNGVESLTNRDVLGALMGQGIRREMLGDIIVRDGRALFFAAEQMKNFFLQNVTSVGRVSVKLKEEAFPYEIPAPRFEPLRLTVASLRADAVVSALSRSSREQAAQMIDEKRVFINHSLLEKKTKEIHAGDRLVIRGSGKWIIDECGDLTKKGRTVVFCRKYI